MAIPIDLSSRKRATVHPDGSGRFQCPECGVVTRLRPRTPVRPSSPVRTFFRCGCGTGHTVYLYTRAARTPVHEPGTLYQPSSSIRAPMTVRNVSRSGLLFELAGPAPLDLGDEVVLHFELPVPNPTTFFKHGTVKRIDHHRVGVEFASEPDLQLERALTACCLETGSF